MKKGKIIAIDSSTEACSVALESGDKIFSRWELAPRKHAERLLPMIDSVLKESELELCDLDAIACCVGPGAFTGLRIAISVAQGLAYAANLSCIAVTSLEVLAAQAFVDSEAEYCLASIDARMKEVYFAAYQRESRGKVKAHFAPAVIGSEHIKLDDRFIKLINENKTPEVLKNNRMVKVGNGWEEYSYSAVVEDLNPEYLPIKYPDALYMLPLAQQQYFEEKLLKAELLQPIYLRNNVAKKKSEQK